jgi:hypothetical protein
MGRFFIDFAVAHLSVSTTSFIHPMSFLSGGGGIIRTLLVILVATVTWIALTASAAIEVREYEKPNPDNLADGLAAWQKVYSVLTSPRCINRHTATNYPQQGDDRPMSFATGRFVYPTTDAPPTLVRRAL